MTDERLLADLRAQLTRYDDEALAALGNRGLLRRARRDLEGGTAALALAPAGRVAVDVGGCRVTFDARGPAHATCTCRASGVCQHILAACVFLKDAGPGASAAAPAAAPEDAEALHEGMMSFDAKQLQAWAGKAALRWAAQFLADRGEADAPAIAREPHIAVEFRHPRLSFRYMGGGLDAIVTDYSGKEPKKHVVAAVLAYQRAHGAELPALEALRAPREGVLDLGKDHTVAALPSESLAELRIEVLAASERLLGECVEIGLSHLSDAIRQRLTTLSVSAQGAELFRLGLALRRLADHADWLLERQGGADEAQMLTELARAFALVQALRAAEATGKTPRVLVGEARSRYEALARVELVGLASWPWRARSGYHGLTTLFWAPREKAWFTSTDARPVSQPGFDPVARYRAPGPWPGLASPEQTLGRRFTLRNAEANRSGRLSSSQKATAGDVALAEAATLTMPPISDWNALKELAREASGRGLAGRNPQAGYALLAPAATERASFDPTTQRLHWPLADAAGKTIEAELEFSALNAAAISQLETAAAERAGSGLRVIVSVGLAGGRVRVQPLGTLRVGKHLEVSAPYFSEMKGKSILAQAWQKMAGLLASQLQTVMSQPPAQLPAVLLDLRASLLRAAERGARAFAPGAASDGLEAAIARCAGAGLVLVRQLAERSSGAERVLRLAYVAEELAVAMGGEAPED